VTMEHNAVCRQRADEEGTVANISFHPRSNLLTNGKEKKETHNSNPPRPAAAARQETHAVVMSSEAYSE
jgi:hypothetical protein